MKTTIQWMGCAVLAAAVAMASGCNAGWQPVPAPRVVMPSVPPAQPMAVAQVAPPSVTDGPPATSVAGIEVRSATKPESRTTRAVLVVQNHTGAEGAPQALSTLRDWLQTALTGGPFAVIEPQDTIGSEQNTGSWGEQMPASSATRLAELLDAPVVLTASVTSARVREIGGTDPGWQAVLEMTLTAKNAATGEAIASVNATARSKKERSSLAFERKGENTWAEVVKEASYTAAKKIRDALPPDWEPSRVPGLLAVAFSANVAGANVRVDGVSHGTIGSEPVLIKLSPGLHNLEIAYPGLVGFKDRVKIREGITFAVTLGLTPEGAVARRRDALFGQLMDRLEKSGATDDLVRELVARGYAQYLTASHAQLDGMPQSLVLENSPGAVLGLPAVGMEMPAGPSTERLFERGGELAK